MKKTAETMTTDKTDREAILESASPVERIKEIAALAVFTLLAAVSSIIIMDIIAYPVTIFAVNNKHAYNYIFKYVFLTFTSFIVLYLILNKSYKLKKDGFSAAEIITYLAKKPFQYLRTIIAMLVITVLLIFIIYLLLSLNYIFLSKITGF